MEHTEKANEDRRVTISLQELACLSGLGIHTVRRLIALDVIEPDQNRPEPRFSLTVVERIRRMRRLHVELGVSWLSMPLVLQLLDRIEAMEAERLGTSHQG
jgi:hypothetical protein